MLNLYIKICLSKAICPQCINEGKERQKHHSHLQEEKQAEAWEGLPKAASLLQN